MFVAMPDGVTAVSVLHRDSALQADSCTPVSMPEGAATPVGMFVDYVMKQSVRGDLSLVDGGPAVAKEASGLEMVEQEKEFHVVVEEIVDGRCA